MQVAISANGNPTQVRQAVASQVKSLRATYPKSAALLAAVNDECAKLIAGATANAKVSVSVTLEVKTNVEEPQAAPTKPADAPPATAPAPTK